MSRTIDYPLLIVTLILFLAGLLIISSASTAISERNFGTLYGYTIRHFIYGMIGFSALFLASRVPYRMWRKVALPLMIASLVLLTLVFFPEIGFRHGGAARWINLGFISFQPSEVLKIMLVMYLAGWLSRNQKDAGGIMQRFVPFTIILSVIGVFLILQPDIGTFVVVAATAVVLYFLGGGKISQLASLGLLGIVGLYALIQIAPYRLNRLTVFLHPDIDPQGIGYHLKQALIAIGTGGFWGRGYGQSIQKYNYLPEPIGDSIFAIFVEEFGFGGGLLLILLFGIFLWRAIAIAHRAPDMFAKFLAAGFASCVAFQTFINMGAISGLLPLTGIPLPFISYGGTALVMTLFSVGVILNISRYT